MLKNKNALIWIFFAVLIFIVAVVPILIEELKRPYLEVVFFDVGQGDSLFIQTKDNFQVLIDGGPSSAVLEKLGQEMPFYDKDIELMILTHPDRDHLFGLLDVLKRYNVKNILWTGVVKNSAEYEEWIRLINEEGANIIIAQAGQKIILERSGETRSPGETGSLYLSVLHPFESLEGQEVEDSNDTSVVVKMVSKYKSFLFTGDISSKEENKLANVDADVLKVAHHGSKTSSAEEFIRAVSPKTAVISVGENSYGHPAPETLQRFKQFGIQVLTTKELGDIRFAF
jgi:competence protein ComEC